MSAGLRVLETRDPQGLTFSDVTDSLEDLREQKRKEAEARGKQRLKDIEAVDNDLKTPYFRNQISKLTKEYQDYVQSPEYDPIKASRMRGIILNAKRNLGELDAYVAESITKDAGIYQERFNELFNGTIDYAPTPKSLVEAKEFADYANIEPKDIIEVYNTDLKGVADGLLKAKETELGKSFNVSGKNFREVIQRLDPEDIDELARVAASRPELQKYYESELGRQITAQELKDLAYNDLFKFTPLERKTRESGFKEQEEESVSRLNYIGDGIFQNKLYNFTKGYGYTEDIQRSGVDMKKYQKITPSMKDKDRRINPVIFYDEDGDLLEGTIRDILVYDDDGGKEIVIIDRRGETIKLPYAINREVIRGEYYLNEDDINYMVSEMENEETTSRGGAPKVGEKRQGADGSMFEYMGGNPADKSNWKKIK